MTGFHWERIISGSVFRVAGSRDRKSFIVIELNLVLNRLVASQNKRSSPLKATPTKEGKKVPVRPPVVDLLLFRIYGKDAFTAFIHNQSVLASSGTLGTNAQVWRAVGSHEFSGLLKVLSSHTEFKEDIF